MGDGGFSAQGLYADIVDKDGKVPHDGTRLGRELQELEESDPKVKKAALELERAKRRITRPEEYAHISIDYCEARARSGAGGVCDAALDANGQCPYEADHIG